MPSCKVTNNGMTLFIDVKHDGFSPILDIILSGYTYKHVDINQAMAVYLKRKSGVENLRNRQMTQETIYLAMSLVKEAAETMIKEDIFDLLFYNN
jgi:hypothetical protein